MSGKMVHLMPVLPFPGSTSPGSTSPASTSAPLVVPAPAYWYSVYGVSVGSDVPFDFPAAGRPEPELAHVELIHTHEGFNERFNETHEPAGAVREAPDAAETRWYICRPMADGSVYLRWRNLYEFRIESKGARIWCRPLEGCGRDVLQNFLFGQALSAALVQQGLEPLHAAVVSVGDGAIGFLGECGSGKSTLAASFLQSGHRLVTDDVLVIEYRAEQPVAHPGTGRVKLHPDSAHAVLGGNHAGAPLNPHTAKRAYRLGLRSFERRRLPLGCLFVLARGSPGEDDSIDVRPLSPAELFVEVVRSTFHEEIDDEERLVRHFASARHVSSAVRGYALRYPRGYEHLPALRDAIVAKVAEKLAEEDGTSATSVTRKPW
jgi:hypothetical protein